MTTAKITHTPTTVCNHTYYTTHTLMDFSFSVCEKCGYQWKVTQEKPNELR